MMQPAGLNHDELLIVGGSDNTDYFDGDHIGDDPYEEFRGDGYILDIPTMKLRTVIRN